MRITIACPPNAGRSYVAVIAARALSECKIPVELTDPCCTPQQLLACFTDFPPGWKDKIRLVTISHVQTPAETRVAVPAKTAGSTLKGRATVKPRKRACAFCGTTKGVTKGPDPYAKELYDDTPVLACDACRDRRRDDV